MWNLIVAHADMPDQMAYTIVKTILDKRDELIQVHKEAQNFDLAHQTQAASPIPYHPGSVTLRTARRSRRQTCVPRSLARQGE